MTAPIEQITSSAKYTECGCELSTCWNLKELLKSLRLMQEWTFDMRNLLRAQWKMGATKTWNEEYLMLRLMLIPLSNEMLEALANLGLHKQVYCPVIVPFLFFREQANMRRKKLIRIFICLNLLSTHHPHVINGGCTRK